MPHLTATAIKSWFQYRCERQFVYSTMSGDERSAIPIVEAAVAPWAEEGVAFEKRVVDELAATTGNALLRPLPGDESLSERMSLSFLRRDNARTWAHQLQLMPTEAFRRLVWPERMPPGVTIGKGFVDLVEVTQADDDLPRFVLYDIKSTRQPQAFHKLQVAWYSLLLRGVLAENGVPGRVAAEGVIWTTGRGATGSDSPRRAFPLRPYEAALCDWARRRLWELAGYRVTRGSDPTPFHIYYKCEQCKYLPHCERSIADDLAPRSLDPSAIPGLTQRSKRAIRAAGASVLGDVPVAIERAAARVDAGWRLRTHAGRLAGRARALLAGDVRTARGRVTLRMPPRSDVAVFVVADHDPINARLAAMGAMVAAGRTRVSTRVRVVASHDVERDALVEVLGTVVGAMAGADARNLAGGTEIVHIFVYEASEAVDLGAALGRHLQADGVRNGLVDLIRMFPPNEVNPEPAYRGYHRLPASALRTVLEDVFELPVKVSYDLARVSAALSVAPSPLAGGYAPTPDFSRPFSSRLSIKQCIAIGEGRADFDAVARDVEARLSAMHAIACWLEDRNAELPAPDRFLRLRKQPFRLAADVDPFGVDSLELLRATELMAQQASFLEGMNRLAEPPDRRAERLTALSGLRLLRAEIGQGWLLFGLPEGYRDSEIQPATMGLVLSDGHPDRLLDPSRWPDYRVDWPVPRRPDHVGTAYLRLTPDARRAGAIAELLQRPPAEPWILDQVPTDLNGPKSVRFLQSMAGA